MFLLQDTFDNLLEVRDIYFYDPCLLRGSITIVEHGEKGIRPKTFLSQVQVLAKDLFVKPYAVDTPLLVHQHSL